MVALVEVTSVRQSKEQDGDTNTGVDLQITDMELSFASDDTKKQAAKLYPDMA